jgi:hypothetical protein
MAVYSFEYTPIPIPPSPPFPSGQLLYRPYLIASVIFKTTRRDLTCLVWLDSGADQCVFPLSFAIALGMDPLTMPMQMTGGVGNAGNATYYGEIEVQIPLNLDLPPISFPVLAGFTAGLEAQGIGLLGQSGFFERHRVTFDRAKRLFHIEK